MLPRSQHRRPGRTRHDPAWPAHHPSCQSGVAGNQGLCAQRQSHCCSSTKRQQHTLAKLRIPDRMPAVWSLCIIHRRWSRYSAQRHQPEIPIAHRRSPRVVLVRLSYACRRPKPFDIPVVLSRRVQRQLFSKRRRSMLAGLVTHSAATGPIVDMRLTSCKLCKAGNGLKLCYCGETYKQVLCWT